MLSSCKTFAARSRKAKAILNDENALRTQVTTSVNQIQESLRLSLLTRQATRAALAAKREVLSQQIKETQEDITRLNARSLQIARLERDAEIEESGYRKYTENVEHTRLDHALELERISNVVLAQPPTLEERIVRPRKLINYAIGLMLATLASISLAVLAEYLRLSSCSLEAALDEEQSFAPPRRTPRPAPTRRSDQEVVDEGPAHSLVPAQPR